jgi:hypothetical protein
VRLNFAAEPVDPNDSTSPWLTAHPHALKAVRKVLGQSDYKAREGVNTGGANGVYWVEIIDRRPDGLVLVRNLTQGAKVQVPEVVEAVESDLLYPLLRGRDVQRWKAEPSAWIIVPHTEETRMRPIPLSLMQECYPRTYGYLLRFKETLDRRRGFTGWERQFQREAFYAIQRIGPYTFAPWKVVWREQARTMTASVVSPKDGKPVMPDHKLMLVDCTSEDEACFVCACLNSSVGQMVAVSYAVEIQMTPHILEHIRIPRFDPGDFVHIRLAELSKEAHGAAAKGDAQGLRAIEAELDRVAAEVWGLSAEELRAVQESLMELSGEVEAVVLEE